MAKNRGKTRASAQIQAVLQKMRFVYLENLPQQLDAMAALAMELKMDEDYQCSYENLYRSIHSLKGTAGTYGVLIISTICEPFEDYLTATLKNSGGASDQQISTCLSFIDLLRSASKLAAEGRQSFPEIEASLEAI